jgi:hypothetical protein
LALERQRCGGLGSVCSEKERGKKSLSQHKEEGKDIPDLSEAQYKLALYQYYNGGFYFAWDAASKKWVKNGKTSYGDDFAQLEAQVASGHPPADWSPENDISV